MADSQTNINLNIDTSQALANLKALQSQISAFQTSMARGSATQAANAAKLRQNLINDINATKKFAAGIENIKTTTESFTTALEKNKLSMGEYFRYAGGATKNFGKLFKTEMATIDKVARERVKTLQTQYVQLGRDASGAMKAIAVRPLVLDMEDLGTKTAIAAQKQQILNQLLKQGSTNLLNWGKNTQWAGRQLMVGFTVPLTMAGSAAAKMYMELEKASIKFKRVYGDFNTTAKETEKMAKDLQFLAQEYTKYGVAVADTMNMAAEAAAAGKVGAELMEQVANATRLSVLGAVEQSQALETTMSLTNAFGLAAEDLAGKINFLNAVENQTVTSIEDLTIAIPKAAPVIKQLGGNVEDLAFFLTAMKEGGINASEGANALKSGIASIINPTGKANEFLQSFGINLKGIVEANKGDIKGTIMQFAQALNTLDPLNRAQAIEQLFGKFQFARLSTLFQNITKEGTQAQRVLELSKATTEELAILSERELKKVESSPMFKFQKAVEDIKVRLVPIGEAFLKAITPVLDFVSKFLDGFNKMSDGAKSFWITLTGLIAGVGPLLLMTVGLVGNGVANLIKMFVGIKSFINRTTQETGFLGESTSYMTQEQIKAASVAASLDQIHQQLTQRFTSEAAAVDQLTAAYSRNIQAQGAFGPAGTMPTTVGKKYAEGGIISGPGTGTSDSIVAMVSNGEAVIPAKSVARNPELVKALIAGNVPELSLGGINYRGDVVKGKYRPIASSMEAISSVSAGLNDELEQLLQNSKTSITHARKIFSMAADASARGVDELQTLVTEVENLTSQGLSGENLKKQLRQNLGIELNNKGAAFAHIGGGANISRETALERQSSGQLRLNNQQLKEVMALPAGSSVAMKHGLGLGNFDQSANAKLAGRGLSIEEFGKAFDNAGLEKWNDSIKFGGGNIEELSADVSILDAKFKELIAAIPAGTQMFDTRAQALEYMSANPGKLASGVDEVYAQARGAISGRKLAGVLDTAAQIPTEIRLPGKVQSKGSASRRPMGSVMPEFDAYSDSHEYLDTTKEELDKPQNDPYPMIRDRNSPHRLAGEDGKDDAKAYKQGFESIPGVEKPIEQQAKPGILQRVKRKVMTTAAGQIGKMYGSEYLGPVGGKAVGDLASRTTGKIMDASYAGLEKLKAKVSSVGQSIVDRWNQSIDDEIAAKNKVHAARVQLSDQMLLATDEEYLALTTQQEIYQQKLLNTNQATEAEIQEALARNQIIQQKRDLLIKEMEENGTDSKVIQERIRLAEQRGVAIDAEQLNNANAAAGNGGAAPARGGRMSGITSKLGGLAMTATMVTGALSMMGGEVGKVSQQIAPLLGGFSTVMMMVQQFGVLGGTLTALIAAVGLVWYGFTQYNDAISSGIDKALEFNDALGSGTKAIQGLAEFAGKVSASEIMDRRRQNALNPYQIVSGKTTFGETFVDSETGTSLVKAATSASASDAGATKSALFSQLSTAVLSNAITTAQARSIAINIGKKMGNVNLGIKLAGELTSLLGPNGENLVDNALEIRVKLVEESQKQMAITNNNLNSKGGMTGMEVLQAGGTAALGAGAGAAAGAAIGSMIFPGIGTAIGAVVGTISGGIYGYFKGAEEYAKRLGALAGANVAMQTNALNQQKQLVDSLQLDYEKRIASAKAAGDAAEAERLQNEYIEKRQGLLDKNSQTMSQIIQSFKTSSYQNEMQSGVEKAIGKKYKDTANEDIATAALENIKSIQDPTQKYTLSMLLNTSVDPMSMLMLTDLMATDAKVIDKAIAISVNPTGAGLGDVLGIASMFVDANNKPVTKLQTEFIARMSTVTDGKTSDDLLSVYSELGKMGGTKIDVPVLVDFVSKNPAQEKEIAENIKEIKDLPNGMLSFEVVQKANILNPEEMKILRDDSEYFNNIKTREQQQIYLSYVSVLEGTTKINDPGFLSWIASPDNKDGLKADSYGLVKYIQWQAQRATDLRAGDNAFVQPANTTTGNGGGPSASWLDDIVKNVRDLQSLGQKLTVGYNASAKALVAFAKTGKNALQGLSGLADKLYANGINQGVIDGILGMSPEDWAKYGKMFVDANGKLTDLTKTVSQIKAQQDIELFTQDSMKSVNTVKQREYATRALVKTTENMALVQALANDETTSALIANGLLGKNLQKQKEMVKSVTKAYLEKLAAERLANGATQNAIDDAQVKIDVLEAESNVYQNGLDIISKRAEKINEVFDKQIQALQEVKSVNDQIAQQKQSELDIADALSRGDIGAAAKAAQQLKAQQAQQAADAQMKALEDAKKRAVEALTVEINGQRLNRADLEQKIYDISVQVLEIKKNEIVQNEVILAKQKEILNSLVAQTAEQIKKNAAASKPITQVINKIIKTTTTGSGSGSGNGNGNQDGKNADPNKPTTDPVTPVTPVTPVDPVNPGGMPTTLMKAPQGSSAMPYLMEQFSDNSFWQGKLDKAHEDVKKKREGLDKFKTELGVNDFDISKGKDFYLKKIAATDTKTRTDFSNAWEALKKALAVEKSFDNGMLKQDKRGQSEGAKAYMENFAKTMPEWLKNNLDILKNKSKQYAVDHDAIKAAKTPLMAMLNKYAFPQNTSKQQFAASAASEADKRVFPALRDAYDSAIKTRDANKKLVADTRKYLNSIGITEDSTDWYLGLGGFGQTYVREKGYWDVLGYNKGGMVIPKRFVEGGYAVGTDTVPAMLTPGEFIVSQPAVKSFGIDNLKAINSGTYGGNSVYNYSVNVSVSNAGANANDIAQTVIAQIKQIDSQRIRSNNL